MTLDHNKKALVTGAAGFVGIHVVRALLARGVRVRAFVYTREDDTLLRGLDVDRVTGDVRDPGDVEQAVSGMDLVVHAAGNVSFQPGDRTLQTEVNVDGTRNMVAASRAAAVQRFVHVSTVSALGYPPHGQVGDEDTPYNWSSMDVGYMETKKAAQDLVLAAAESGMDAVVCNPTTMFGPDDINMNAASYVSGFQAVRGLMVCPAGGTNVADVRAVAAGILQVAEKGRPGECYVLGGVDMTYRDLFRAILARLGKGTPVLVLPSPVMSLAAFLSEACLGWMKGGPPLTRDMAGPSSRLLFYRSDKAVRELGYEPGDPRQAIGDTIDWMRSTGAI